MLETGCGSFGLRTYSYSESFCCSSIPGFWAGCDFIWGRCLDSLSLPMACEGGIHAVMACLLVTRDINNLTHGNCLWRPQSCPVQVPGSGLSLTYSQSQPCADLALLSGDLGTAQVPACLCVSSEAHLFCFFDHVPLFLTQKLGSWDPPIGWNICWPKPAWSYRKTMWAKHASHMWKFKLSCNHIEKGEKKQVK